MSGELVYEARGLVKEYDDGSVRALRGVDLEIRQGEFVAIIGPSGCGKTTLLQMLGTLDFPSGGTLNYRGKSLPGLADHAAYRAHEIGFIFQSFHLLPTFTSAENVQIPMMEGNRSISERRKRALELLESVGLAKRADHLPSKMSGGERQRVAVARSLANDPTVLLADEPTGNLDSENTIQVLDLLTRIHREKNMTMVMVTHDMSVARRADRAIAMRDGQVIFAGDPKDIPKSD